MCVLGVVVTALYRAHLLISPWHREAPEAFALAVWVTSKAKEATVQCQASRGFQLNC